MDQKPHQICDQPLKIDKPYDKDQFYLPEYCKEYIDQILIPKGLIECRIEKLAHDIANYYQDRPFITISLLKGSIRIQMKIAHCLSEIYKSGKYKNCVRNEYVRVKSYVNDQSSGTITMIGLESVDFTGKEVLVIEDIVDTGLTLTKFNARLYELGAKDVKVFSLLSIEQNRREDCKFTIDFLGFYIPNYFLVGYGIDYNDNMRDLDHICVINQKGKEVFRKN
eukprot:TRINITY_DN2468_c0_g1_i4.p1 TRINITY_DN2468_c0_g1~~TRINITY_DN2468_c0_g1_i4.p1  ORF type:complete len:223 (-),score=26.94 TRINITY_DN2468_c0_g1_i4:171-839(-)